MINFIGIGAQKCASSWIYEILKNSHQTCVSDVKELDFFSYYYDKGYEWYHSNFAEPEKKIIGEISPSYFYNSDVPRRVFEYNKDMKVVLSLRDPIKRMFSNHLHEVRAGNVTGKNLNFEHACTNNPLYFEQSTYDVHLKKWLAFFKMKSIHIVFQEDVRKNPQKVSDDLFDFLELERIELLEVAAVNASLQNKNPVLGSVLELGGDVLRTLKLKGVLNDLKSSKVLGSVYKGNKMHISDIVEPIQPDFEAKLEDRLRPHNEQLKVLLSKVNLPWETQ